jgi:HD superfamily phosphodiesterase
MTSNLDKLIRKTEEKWLQPLMDACTHRFEKVHLPSHDAWHHFRVWKYAKTLLHYAVKQNVAISETDIERLMIAVFFHDQGMSETQSKDHGKISRQVCKSFFTSYGPVPGFDKVLQAIEDHDKKNYLVAQDAKSGYDLQTFLNIADDLDAFGVVGAYRYLEIYLLRNAQIQLLPDMVLANLNSRFQHFAEALGSDKLLVKSQNHRYIAARNYFKDLNLQLKMVEYQPDSYLGPIGVVNFIHNDIMLGKKPVKEVCDKVLSSNADFYSYHFFDRLKKELQ